jgi:multidrug efflux pump subunit AcrA (membrane-fusion protein)
VNQKSNEFRKVLFGILVPLALVGVGVGAYVAMGEVKAKPAQQSGKDTISKLRKLPIVAVGSIASSESLESLDVSISGTVVPFRQINLAVEVAGRVRLKSENCQIGRFVKQGDVLFELDPTDFELEVERLQAMRESEYAQQRELDQEISNANNSLSLAEEELAIQERELKRLGTLPKGFASDTELDQARRQKVASANQRLTIQNQLQMFETRRTRLKLAERLAAAQLQQARVNLERTKIVSPIDGVIVTESVQTDSFVQRGATLCVIEDTQCVEVSCNLRTDQLLLVLEQRSDDPKSDPSSRVVHGSSYELPKTDVTVSYRVTGREDISYEWKGHLSRYEGVGLDPQSRTVPIRIRVDNPREVYRNGTLIDEQSNGGLPALVRGMFVECNIHTDTPRNTILIPKLGLKPGNQVWKFVRDDSLVANEAEVPEAVSNTPKETDDKKPVKNLQLTINPSEWAAGRLQVISNVRVINLIRQGPDREEFWVAETKSDLQADDQLIVSPLANLAGDGTDQVRYQTRSAAASANQKAKE